MSAVACALQAHSKPSWHYVKAHDDHPWHEMADSLAIWAAKGNLCNLPIPLIPTLQAGPGAAWEWIRVVDQVALEAYPACDGARFTGALSASEACGLEPSMQLPLCEPRSLSLDVQTLAGTRDRAALKVDRRVMLAQQLKDKSVLFAGLQETRGSLEVSQCGDLPSLRPRQLEVWVVVSCGSILNSATSRNPKFHRHIALWCTPTIGFLWPMSGQRGLQCTLVVPHAPIEPKTVADRESNTKWWDSLTGTITGRKNVILVSDCQCACW